MNSVAYKKVMQFVDDFSKKPIVGGMVGEKINELKQLPEKIKQFPQRFVEDYENTMRLGNLPKDNPERVAFDQQQKNNAIQMAMSMGLTSPIASPGVAQSISQQSSLLLGQKELEATRLLRGGAKPQDLVKKGFTMGEVQKASQRNQGLGLLADFDNASQAKNPELMKQIANAVDNMPQNSPYAPYKGQFTSVLNTIPQAPVAPQTTGVAPIKNSFLSGLREGLRQSQESAGKKGYNAPLYGYMK